MTDERIAQIESMPAFEAWRDGIHELIAEVRRLGRVDGQLRNVIDARNGAVESLEVERDALRAEVARLRSEARQFKDENDIHAHQHARERDALRAEVERLRDMRCDCDEETPGGHAPGCISSAAEERDAAIESCNDLSAQLAVVTAERDRLRDRARFLEPRGD